MKSMIEIFLKVYTDVYTLTGASTSEKDSKYLRSRVEHEGISFLTITLPALRDLLEKGLRTGRWPREEASAFAGATNKAFPKFLSGLLRLVFDYETGVLYDEPNIAAIAGFRQLTSLFKKVALDCSKARIDKAYIKYLSTDTEVKSVASINRIDLLDLRWVFSQLYHNPLSIVETSIIDGTLLPRHGGGAVAEGLSQNEKFSCDWYQRLEPLFPSSWYLHPNLGVDYTGLRWSDTPVGRELPAKVIHVTKTLKTPRLIAMEPSCIQYMQQALMRATYDAICNDRFAGPTLNLRSQESNGLWALEGSKNGKYATLDLSEASDRVGAGLVSFLTRYWPNFREGLFRARSSRVSINRGALTGTYRLRKFASMGSAMCFPIEAMVFSAIAILVMHKVDGRAPTRTSVRKYARMCKVFGDDIIVPTHYAPLVALGLSFFGLKVNETKSFWTGKFRESCGVDAYDGYNITPTYIRSLPPRSTRNANEVVAWVSLCNQLFKAGLWRASDYVRQYLEKTLKTRLPLVLATSPALGLSSPWSNYYDQASVNCPVLHRPRIRAFVAKSDVRRRSMVGEYALIKSLLGLGESHGVSPVSFSDTGAFLPNAEDEEAHCRLRRMLLSPRSGSKGLDIESKPRGLVIYRGWTTPF